MPSQGFRPHYEAEALSAELAKMLGLVAPSSMTADQQTLWLVSAVDALEDIRASEVAHISAQVRRTVKRHNDIVPEIAKLVAERRKENAESARRNAYPPPPPEPPRQPGPPLTAKEIAAMPKWLKDTGLRIGFLRRDGDRLVDVEA